MSHTFPPLPLGVASNWFAPFALVRVRRAGPRRPAYVRLAYIVRVSRPARGRPLRCRAIFVRPHGRWSAPRTVPAAALVAQWRHAPRPATIARARDLEQAA